MDSTKMKLQMNFSQLVLQQNRLIFDKYNLHVIEQDDNYIKLLSKKLQFIIVHNKRENSNTFFIGRKDKNDVVEIDNDLLERFFQSKLELSEVSIDVFLRNLEAFFENEAKPLLTDDLNFITQLEKFDLERSNEYTLNLLMRQKLIAADDAWSQSNYKEFINLIDQINNEDIPASYLLKYKIANQRLRNDIGDRW